MAANPTMGDPAGTWTRWNFPASWYPCVGVPIPAVIASDPNVIWAGRYGSRFDDRRRGSDSNDHFSAHGTGCQE